MPSNKNKLQNAVLIVDDEGSYAATLKHRFEDENFKVVIARDAGEYVVLTRKHAAKLSLVLVDAWRLPQGKLRAAELSDGLGWAIAASRIIRKDFPLLNIYGFSNDCPRDVSEWFKEHANGFFTKDRFSAREFRATLRFRLKIEPKNRGLRCFVVHGHDEVLLQQLKEHLQKHFGLPEPIVLREQPSLGRTIIEKFEEEAELADLVFVLLSPDDRAISSDASNEEKRRARQNVIFELGYFYGKMQRLSGRVFLLYRGSVELPSDIAGIIWIDVSNGIDAAHIKLKSELTRLLKASDERA